MWDFRPSTLPLVYFRRKNNDECAIDKLTIVLELAPDDPCRCLACFPRTRLDDKQGPADREIITLIPEPHARRRQSFTLAMSLRGYAVSGCDCVPMAYP